MTDVLSSTLVHFTFFFLVPYILPHTILFLPQIILYVFIALPSFLLHY